jgi:hypothetical protein
MKTFFVCAAVATLLFIIQSCSTTAPTKVVGEWASPEYKKVPIHNALILAATDDEWQRGAFETTLKEQLEKRGVKATSTLQAMPENVKPTKELLLKYVKENAIDAVFVSQLLSVDTKEATTDVYFTQRTPIQLEATFYGYYPNVFDRQYYPGMASNTDIIRVETRLYETKEAKLIWRALSKTYNPKSAMEIMQSLTKAIVDTLAQDGVVGKK